ncbi:hypothetical protein DZF96_07080 [Clavibacter michiganensis]|uniref:Uncharacterized protein n=2 Tax=Clavibacter TaxID=1573 RepID=A0A399NW12_9MICO|nr:hypothetical protein DZF96_07080 [Clavibacter michiganensis]
MAVLQLSVVVAVLAGTFVLAPLSVPPSLSGTYARLISDGGSAAAIAVVTIVWLAIAVVAYAVASRMGGRVAGATASWWLVVIVIGSTASAAVGPEAMMSSALERVHPLEGVVWMDMITAPVRNAGLVAIVVGLIGFLVSARRARAVSTRTAAIRSHR